MEKPQSPGRGSGRNDLRIRRAAPGDHRDIEGLMQALDLSYSSMDMSCFWVAEQEGKIVGAAELKDLQDCSLLSCVGVRPDLQGSGIGRALVAEVAKHARHDVYLYTRVPDFFRKAGFSDARSLPADLPPRSIYGCEGCDPHICFCLVRHRHDS